MQDLYTEKDFESVSAQLRKRYLVLALIAGILLAVVVWSMIVRIEWLTMLSVFLCGGVIIFAADLFCLPLLRYRKLLTYALTGINHTETLEYKEQEAGDSLVDGVRCLGLIFLGEPDRHGAREQRLYWDAELPLPAFRAGDQVTVKYTGKNIIGYQL